jgi:hypothetical protein
MYDGRTQESWRECDGCGFRHGDAPEPFGIHVHEPDDTVFLVAFLLLLIAVGGFAAASLLGLI